MTPSCPESNPRGETVKKVRLHTSEVNVTSRTQHAEGTIGSGWGVGWKV